MSKFGQITTPPNTGFGTGGGSGGAARNTLVLEQTMTALIKCKAKNLKPNAETALWELTVYSDPDYPVHSTAMVRGFLGTDPGAEPYHTPTGGKKTDWCCQTKCDDHQLGSGYIPVSDEWEASILASYLDISFWTHGVDRTAVEEWDGQTRNSTGGFSKTETMPPGHCPAKSDAVKLMKKVFPRPIEFWNFSASFGKVKLVSTTPQFGEDFECPPDPKKPIEKPEAFVDAFYKELSALPGGLGDYLEFLRPATETYLPDILKVTPETFLYNWAIAAVPNAATALKVLNTIGTLTEETNFDGGCGPWCKCDFKGLLKCWKCEATDLWTKYGKGSKYECTQSVDKKDGYCPYGSYETQEACEKALKEQGCKDPGDLSQ